MAERIFPATPVSTAGGRVITSPFQFVLTGEDAIRMTSVCSIAGVRLTMQGRRMDEQGRLVPFSYEHIPLPTRTAHVTDYTLGVGAILNLTVWASSGAPLSGQTYVQVQLIRGLSGATLVLGTLLGGYVTATQALGWPGSPILASTDGEPPVQVVEAAGGLIGSDFQFLVPAGARWELLSMFVLLQTSAVGADRLVCLMMSTGTAQLGVLPPPFAQPPSVGWAYSWGQGLPPWKVTGHPILQASIPTNQRLPAGCIFGSSTYNLDVADSWSARAYSYREWLEVP